MEKKIFMNKKGGILAYLFWMIVGIILGGVFFGATLCDVFFP